jgi:hypothetical protein
VADNTVLPPGSSGDTIRTIDRTTSKTQVIALDVGGEGGPEALATQSNPFPVQDPTVIALLQQILAVNMAQLLHLQSMSGQAISPADLMKDEVISTFFE